MPDTTGKPISLNRFLITVAWAIMLVVSMAPNALLHELAGGSPACSLSSTTPASGRSAHPSVRSWLPVLALAPAVCWAAKCVAGRAFRVT